MVVVAVSVRNEIAAGFFEVQTGRQAEQPRSPTLITFGFRTDSFGVSISLAAENGSRASTHFLGHSYLGRGEARRREREREAR